MLIVIMVMVALLGLGFLLRNKMEDKDDAVGFKLTVGDVPSVQTFAAVDANSVNGVHIAFDGVEIQPVEGQRMMFSFPSKVINLMDPISNNELLNGVIVPVGTYSWIRVSVITSECFVVVDGVSEPLTIPSGDQTGLKLNTMFVVDDQGADFTIDFNLEKSLIETGKGQYKMKPTLKLIDNNKELPEQPVGSPAVGSPQ